MTSASDSGERFIVHQNIPYGQDPRQIIDLFVPTSISQNAPAKQPLPLLVYLHGGAWRTESIKGNHDLGAALASSDTAAVALVEYRLSLLSEDESAWPPEVQHPRHLLDVYAGLKFLLDKERASQWNYDAEKVVVAGHSAGAWMVSSMLLDAAEAGNDEEGDGESIVTACPRFSLTARAAIRAFIGIDGLYDLVYLLEKYPSYMSFVSQAFCKTPIATKESYTKKELQPLECVSVNRWKLNKAIEEQEGQQSTKFYFLHSREDSLLDQEYEEQALAFFKETGVDLQVDFDSLKGDHDEATHCQAFFTLLQRILQSI